MKPIGYKSYERIADVCEECGEFDDRIEIPGLIQFYVTLEDGTRKWVCLKCAAIRYHIPEARLNLSNTLPNNPDYQENFFARTIGEAVPEDEPSNLLEELEMEAKIAELKGYEREK